MQLDAIGKKDLEVLKNWEFIQFNQDPVFGACEVIQVGKWTRPWLEVVSSSTLLCLTITHIYIYSF